MIREITGEAELAESLAFMQECFAPVAQQLQLTPENCPGMGSFFSMQRYKPMMRCLNERLFSLEDEGKKAGFVTINSLREKTLTFSKLAVRIEDWEKGYAYRLLDFVEQQGREQDAEKVRVGLINENEALREWYKAQGFHLVDVKRFDALPFSICLLEKRIS